MGKRYAVLIAVILTVFVGIGCNSGSDVGSSVWSGLPTSGSTGVLTGLMQGKVTDRFNNPVEKALIEMLASASTTVYVGFTDETGSYKFSDIPVGSYQVRVSKGKFIYLYQYITIIPENIVQFSAVLDPDSGVLAGKVVNALTNQNLANVQIQIFSENDPTNPVTGSATVSTGQDGTFRVSLSSGTYSLIVSKNDFTSQKLTGVLIRINQQTDLSQNVALSPTVGILAGTVLDVNNQPINGALVEVKSLTDPLALAQTMISGGSIATGTGEGTASETAGTSTIQLSPGAFQFTLMPGTYHIQATMNGLLAASTAATVNVAGSTQVTLKLTSTPIIIGKVSGYDQGSFSDLQGVFVQATSIASGKIFSSQTDTTGSYTIPVTTGTFSVSFTKVGYLAESRTGISVGESGATINLEMYPNPIITGTVNAMVAGILTAQGNAQVTVQATQSGVLTTVVEGTTDASGLYTLEVSSTGRYRVIFNQGGFSILTQDVDIASRGKTLNVTLGNLPQVAGVVLKPDSTNSGAFVALPDATVSAVNQTTSVRSETKTGTDGSFKLNLEPGTYDITFFLSGYVGTTTTKLVPLTGLFMDNVTLYPPSLPTGLSGTIYSSVTFTAVYGALVELIGTGGAEVGSTLSDSSTGEYKFSNLSPGSYSLKITKEGFIPATASVDIPVTGKIQNVTIFSYPAITGTIKSFNSAVPPILEVLADVNIRAENALDSSKIFQTTTDSSGKYRLTVDPNATYAISFTKNLYQTVLLETVPGVSANAVIVKTSDVIQDLTMDRLVLKGFVYKTSGTGLSDCLVEASGTILYPSTQFSTRSTSDGSYEIYIPSPEFTVRFLKEGYDTSSKTMTTNGNMALDVTLSQNSSISGYVLASPSMPPVAGAEIRVLKEEVIGSGNFTVLVKSVISGEDGHYSVNLPDGTYGFSVIKADYKVLNASIPADRVTVTQNTPKTKDFILEKSQ